MQNVRIVGTTTDRGELSVAVDQYGKIKTSELTDHRAATFETIVVSNAHAETLTALTYEGTTKALVTLEGNSVRCRWDGPAPTASIGHLVLAGSTIELSGHDITHFGAIAVGADATMTVTYSNEA